MQTKKCINYFGAGWMKVYVEKTWRVFTQD